MMAGKLLNNSAENSMGKCRVCKKNCDCQLQYCESCIEDLSEDDHEIVPAKKKLIEKKQANKKSKIKSKSNITGQEDLMSQESNTGHSSNYSEQLKLFCDQLYIDMHLLQQRDLQYFQSICCQNFLSKQDKLLLAQSVSIGKVNMKFAESRLQTFFKVRKIQQCQLITTCQDIEFSSVITSFFDGSNIPLLFSKDELNNQTGLQFSFILNLGCNLQKGQKFSKNGRSFLIFKPHIKPRCLLEVVNVQSKQKQYKLTAYPQDLLSNLKDEEVERVIKGFKESVNCLDDANGYCKEVKVVGSVRASKDIQKIMLSPEQMTYDYKHELESIKKRYGIEWGIIGYGQ